MPFSLSFFDHIITEKNPQAILEDLKKLPWNTKPIVIRILPEVDEKSILDIIFNYLNKNQLLEIVVHPFYIVTKQNHESLKKFIFKSIDDIPLYYKTINKKISLF